MEEVEAGGGEAERGTEETAGAGVHVYQSRGGRGDMKGRKEGRYKLN